MQPLKKTRGDETWRNYCWWTKSCTTKDDEYPIIYRVLTIPGGAGFCPSTVPNLYSSISDVLNFIVSFQSSSQTVEKNHWNLALWEMDEEVESCNLSVFFGKIDFDLLLGKCWKKGKTNTSLNEDALVTNRHARRIPQTNSPPKHKSKLKFCSSRFLSPIFSPSSKDWYPFHHHAFKATQKNTLGFATLRCEWKGSKHILP